MASWYNRVIGSPKWAYEGIKGEIVSVVGGAGNYIVDSVSDIALGTGGAIEDIGGNVGKGTSAVISGVTAPVGQLGKDLTLPLLIAAGFFLLKK
jgi:hypothetical protein